MPIPRGVLGIALGVSQLLYLSIMGALGVRLALLSWRRRQLPEALLAAHFLLCCTLAYVLLATGMAIAQAAGAQPPGAVLPLIAAGHLLSIAGVFAVAAFNTLVFRRRQVWAHVLLACFGLLMVVGYAGYGWSGGFSDARFSGGWYALLYGSYMGVAAWVLLEPLLFWSRMRRRERLGLAEPVEVNRFLLWGTGSGLRLLMLAAGAVPMALAGAMTPDHLAAWAPGILITSALAGIGVAAAYWLTFFPTRRYLAFVRRARPSPAG